MVNPSLATVEMIEHLKQAQEKGRIKEMHMSPCLPTNITGVCIFHYFSQLYLLWFHYI